MFFWCTKCVSFHCTRDPPDVLILQSTHIQGALKNLNAEHIVLPFQTILNTSHQITVKFEALGADDEGKDKSSAHGSGQNKDDFGLLGDFRDGHPTEDVECWDVKEEELPVEGFKGHDGEEEEEVRDDYETKDTEKISRKVLKEERGSITKNSFECQRCTETFKGRVFESQARCPRAQN